MWEWCVQKLIWKAQWVVWYRCLLELLSELRFLFHGRKKICSSLSHRLAKGLKWFMNMKAATWCQAGRGNTFAGYYLISTEIRQKHSHPHQRANECVLVCSCRGGLPQSRCAKSPSITICVWLSLREWENRERERERDGVRLSHDFCSPLPFKKKALHWSVYVWQYSREHQDDVKDKTKCKRGWVFLF